MKMVFFLGGQQDKSNIIIILLKKVYPILMQKNTSNMLPIVTGPSLGANQAAITFLRRPELFSGLLALSGVYNSDYFFMVGVMKIFIRTRQSVF